MPSLGDFFIKEYHALPQADRSKTDFAKRSLADRKALIVELPKGVTVGVNLIYPTTIPLATFPANLLKALPELPPELEYRIVGRDSDPAGRRGQRHRRRRCRMCFRFRK